VIDCCDESARVAELFPPFGLLTGDENRVMRMRVISPVPKDRGHRAEALAVAILVMDARADSDLVCAGLRSDLVGVCHNLLLGNLEIRFRFGALSLLVSATYRG
jgi:hypothetical protein